MISTASAALLQRLTDGDAKPVLVADFQAWATAPRLSELLSRRTRTSPVYRIDPISVLSNDERYVPLTELADACAERYLAAPPIDGHVHLVGHCSASALALHVARRLADESDVTVILVAPTWPDDDLVRAKFAEFLGNVGAPPRLCPALGGDPAAAVNRLEEALRRELVAVANARGVDPAAGVFAELLGWYRGWLAFLLACHHDPTATWIRPAEPGPAEVVVLTGPDTVPHVPGLVPGSYAVTRVPVLAENSPITPDLADALLPHLGWTA
jgi:hypothetical protein